MAKSKRVKSDHTLQALKYIEPFVEHSFIEIIFWFYVKIIVFCVRSVKSWDGRFYLTPGFMARFGHSTISGVQRER